MSSVELDTTSARSLGEFVPLGGVSTTRRRLWSRKMVADFLAVVDVALVMVCAVVAKLVYLDWYLDYSAPLAPYLSVAALAGLFAHFSLKKNNLYDPRAISQSHGRNKKILIGLSGAFLILIAVGYLLKDAHYYSRGWLMMWFLMSLVLIVVRHHITIFAARRLIEQGYFLRNVAIYGAGRLGHRLSEFLSQNDYGLNVVGLFDDQDLSPRRNGKSECSVLGGLDDLVTLSRGFSIDRIILAVPASSDANVERISNIMAHLTQLPNEVYLCTDFASFNLRYPRVSYVGPLGLLELQSKPLGDWNRVSKTAVDYVGSILALIFLAPLFALVAIAIKLDSRGPVFFHQRRHGFNHEIINVLKFRTMTVMEDGEIFQQARRNDHRVTRVGKFLRRTSIDELPQFWNALRGEMSIVGPRPHAVAHNDQFFTVFQDYATRHKVKPGITGWAQINGCRGETDTEEKMRKRVDLDLQYIKDWTIWLDFSIIIRTAYTVLKGTNAH